MLEDFKEMVHEQLEFRELLWQMTKRDLLLRYKQTLMGFAWALFMPLVNTLIFSVVFTRIAHVDVGVPYPLYAFTGLLAWNFFSSSMRFAAVSLSSNASLVGKVYFPREVFPLAQVFVCFIDTLVAGTCVLVLMLWYGYVPGLAVVWLPLVLFAHLALTSACALLLSMANLFYRDVKYIVDVLLAIGMFSTTALYPATTVGGRTGLVLQLNPLSIIIDAYRSVLFTNSAPLLPPFLVTLAGSAVLVLWAWLVFHRAEYQFAESV